MAVTTEEVADAMFEMVKECQGSKAAIRTLMDTGKCVYTYFGGSYIEIPHEEGAASGE
jgi:hypothetical protein